MVAVGFKKSSSTYLVAQFAGVRLLPGVHPEVELEGGGVGEGSGADLAGVGPLPGVNPHVHRQLGPLVELGAALPALVRLVLRVRGVGPHVVFNVSLERLVADVAFVHLLSFVEREDVPLEGVSSGVRLLKGWTLIQ